MSKIILIGDSNILHMPYINTYIDLLEKSKIDYSLIIWNRFKIKENATISYEDKKIGHKRNFIDYFKYYIFILEQLKKYEFDKIIIFGIPMSFFLRKYLIKNYPNKYIVDIRDYHKILKIYNIEGVISNSYRTVISSPQYVTWLPKNDKYLINHNTSISNVEIIEDFDFEVPQDKIVISTIGSIRHWNINTSLIEELKNNKKFVLVFHGEGTINEKLKQFIEDNKIDNVYIYGRYEKEHEIDLYRSTHLINMLLERSNLNSKTALSNRLYNSAFYGRPMIALRGTYLADLIEQYKLGLVVDTLDNLENKILSYLLNYNSFEYNQQRIKFIKKILVDNSLFSNIIDKFICT